jgi:hypothetical protein
LAALYANAGNNFLGTDMTSIERKQKTESLLKDLGIPFIDHLPTVEEEDEVNIRTPKEIAKRLLCLTYLCYATEDEESKEQIIDFLKKENLWDSVTEDEKILFTKPKLTDQERVNVSWRSEAIWLLLWTIQKVDILDLPIDEVNIADIVNRLPKLMSSTKDFIESATIRTTGDILDQSDLIYRLHWATRQAELDNDIELELNPSIVVERHYAINWVTYYGENWDDITTDT